VEATDAAGEVCGAVEVVAERDGLDVPAAPALWVARRLLTAPPGSGGVRALADLVPAADALAWLSGAGFQVSG
jgi:hypothetical protein